jgi:hypothetical protein
VLVRHEQAAAHAADVAQRLCRVPHRRSNAQPCRCIACVAQPSHRCKPPCYVGRAAC